MAAERLVEDQFDNVIPTDPGIFVDLYPYLRRFAAVVGPMEVDPDDLVQDAIERTLKRQPLTTLENPRAYLSKTILNLASNHRRSMARARRSTTRLHSDEATLQSPLRTHLLTVSTFMTAEACYLRNADEGAVPVDGRGGNSACRWSP